MGNDRWRFMSACPPSLSSVSVSVPPARVLCLSSLVCVPPLCVRPTMSCHGRTTSARPCIFTFRLFLPSFCLFCVLCLLRLRFCTCSVHAIRRSEDSYRPSHHQGPRYPSARRGYVRARLREREGKFPCFFFPSLARFTPWVCVPSFGRSRQRAPGINNEGSV